jgi:hypothetical protein
VRKTILLSAAFTYISTLILTASTQTAEPSNANSQGGTALIGQVIAVVWIVAVFAVIAYAGYKVVKKWSRPQPD